MCVSYDDDHSQSEIVPSPSDANPWAAPLPPDEGLLNTKRARGLAAALLLGVLRKLTRRIPPNTRYTIVLRVTSRRARDEMYGPSQTGRTRSSRRSSSANSNGIPTTGGRRGRCRDLRLGRPQTG
jgi:hypothetical protein